MQQTVAWPVEHHGDRSVSTSKTPADWHLIESAGGVLEEIIELKTSINPMNPTYAFIINPKLDKPEVLEENPFLCPATGFKLEKKETCYFSPESLLAYPIIEGIPVLKSDFAIIASKMAL